MQLYESIFKRKSTRKYDPEKLPSEQLLQILDFAGRAKPLDPQLRTRIELVDAAAVKGMVLAKAPHYLLLYSEEAEGYLTNAGFLLQQVDLYLASLGLGSCWLGMAKTTAPTKEGLGYVIMLAFGKAHGEPHRGNLSEFSRKSLSEIALGQDDRLDAVRLAPSASNSQPWYFVCQEDGLFVYRKTLGLLKAAMYDTMNQIDMGIALCHLWLASAHFDRSFSFIPGAHPGAPKIKGYTYIGKSS